MSMPKIRLDPNSNAVRIHGERFDKWMSAVLDILANGKRHQIDKALNAIYIGGIPTQMRSSLLSEEGKSYLHFVEKEHSDHNLAIADAAILSEIVKQDIDKFKLRKANVDVRNCRKVLHAVFSYDAFRDGRAFALNKSEIRWGDMWSSDWDAFQFLQSLGLSICPYCNGETVYAVEVKKANGNRMKIVRSALDHFFCRAYFPYLGLSLYNLVPSCTRCNTSLKGRRVMLPDKSIHPYLDDAYSYADFIIEDGDMLSISENSPKGHFQIGLSYKKGESHADIMTINKARFVLDEVFKTKTIYNELYYSDAASVIYRTRKLSLDAIKFLKGLCAGVSPDSLIYGYPLHDRNVNRYRLAKMTIDLVKFVRKCQAKGNVSRKVS